MISVDSNTILANVSFPLMLRPSSARWIHILQNRNGVAPSSSTTAPGPGQQIRSSTNSSLPGSPRENQKREQNRKSASGSPRGQQQRSFFSLRSLFEELSQDGPSRRLAIFLGLFGTGWYASRLATHTEVDVEAGSDGSGGGPNPRVCILRDVKSMIVNSPLLCSESVLRLLDGSSDGDPEPEGDADADAESKKS